MQLSVNRNTKSSYYYYLSKLVQHHYYAADVIVNHSHTIDAFFQILALTSSTLALIAEVLSNFLFIIQLKCAILVVRMPLNNEQPITVILVLDVMKARVKLLIIVCRFYEDDNSDHMIVVNVMQNIQFFSIIRLKILQVVGIFNCKFY